MVVQMEIAVNATLPVEKSTTALPAMIKIK